MSAAVKTALEPPLSVAAPAACVLILNKEEIKVPASAFTLSGFRAWARSDDFPEQGRISFIDQEVVIDMVWEEIQSHAAVKGEVSNGIYNLNRQMDLGLLYLDGVRVSNDEAGVSNVPDAVFVSWETLDSERARFVARENQPQRLRELEGTPDWVLEIISDSSVRKDTCQLRESYHRAGIPEYWLIDARGEEIEFQILLHRPEGHEAAPRRGNWQRSDVFGRKFRLDRKRGRRDLWQYALQVKPL